MTMTSEIIGRTATVCMRIPNASEPGEIDVTVTGMHQRLLAHAQHPVEVGTTVVVTAIFGAGSVSVTLKEAS
jgi:hypothetical protein